MKKHQVASKSDVFDFLFSYSAYSVASLDAVEVNAMQGSSAKSFAPLGAMIDFTCIFASIFPWLSSLMSPKSREVQGNDQESGRY